MGKRGVTRPGAMHEEDKGANGGNQGGMSHDERLRMLHHHHAQTLWVYWLVVILGAWNIVAPFLLGYDSGTAQPAGGRSVWLGLEARAAATTWSDMVAGFLLVLFGWRSLTPNRPVSVWLCCFVGIWLNLAPIVFWAPSAAAWLNGSLVGMLVIALTVLIPGMPNMIMYHTMGPDVPAGWSYNPSSWPQRAILILLAFAGWLTSRYLAAYQLGYIEDIADPFFGNQTVAVLESDMSEMWPVSDAAFGAFAYTIEFLMGFMGSQARWRTMPWMVTFFGILVIPLGLVHIFLVISQPIIVGAWCTFCLLAALFMLPMIPLQVDEVAAMGQLLVEKRRQGESLWKVFWKGASTEGEEDKRTPAMADLPREPRNLLGASVWGMSAAWGLLAASLLGLWLMFSPEVFGIQGLARNLHVAVGALIFVNAVIAMGEPLRLVRFGNVLLGLGLAVAVWLIEGGTTGGNINAVVIGLLIAALSLPRGKKTERYGIWDRWVR